MIAVHEACDLKDLRGGKRRCLVRLDLLPVDHQPEHARPFYFKEQAGPGRFPVAQHAGDAGRAVVEIAPGITGLDHVGEILLLPVLVQPVGKRNALRHRLLDHRIKGKGDPGIPVADVAFIERPGDLHIIDVSVICGHTVDAGKIPGFQRFHAPLSLPCPSLLPGRKTRSKRHIKSVSSLALSPASVKSYFNLRQALFYSCFSAFPHVQ